jgi:hypothetical protein
MTYFLGKNKKVLPKKRVSNNVCILRSRQEKNIFISNALLIYGVYNYALTLSENGGGGEGG